MCDRHLGQATAEVRVELIDDDVEEADETFYVELRVAGSSPSQCELGECACATVTIVDDDGPGALVFEKDVLRVPETDDAATIVVRRVGGTRGAVSCQWYTQPGSATPQVRRRAESSPPHLPTASAIPPSYCHSTSPLMRP